MMGSPRFLFIFGVLMMVVGIVLPFLMMIKIVPSTFFLNFFSWGVSSSGLAMAMVGFTMFTKNFRE